MLSANHASVWPKALSLVCLCWAGFCLADEAPPTRANDLAYGEVLYDFYQQDYFRALTHMAVAETRGGIHGHGDHPDILKGGMLLSYGMIEPARRIFVKLLDPTDEDVTTGEESPDAEEKPATPRIHVSEKVRTQAWFYLGKVYYLKRDWQTALNAFAHITVDALEEWWPEQLDEFYYLKTQCLIASGQLEQADDLFAEMIDARDEQSALEPYLQFNLAVARLPQDSETAIASLQAIQFPEPEDESSPDAEVQALKDRIQLTLASIFMAEGDASRAMSAYRQVRLNGPWSERALFGFALAAANTQKFGLALEALNRLSELQSDSPWVQESHFAIAYVYEQLKQEGRALKAYENAVAAYGQSAARLTTEISQMDENFFVGKMAASSTSASAAKVSHRSTESNTSEVSDTAASTSEALEAETTDTTESSMPATVVPVTGYDDPALTTDSFGRLLVQPTEPNLALLFSSEAFLHILKDIRELTLLKNDLTQWKQSVASFELMLETRKSACEKQVAETANSLADARFQQVTADREKLAGKVEAGVSDATGMLFLDESQQEYKTTIAGIRHTLDTLTADTNHQLLDADEINEYREKLRRVEGFFIWDASERSSAQAWEAQRALKALDKSLEEFRLRRQKLQTLMGHSDEIASLEGRVQDVQPRVTILLAKVEQVLSKRQQDAVAMAQQELAGQQARVVTYLNASRLARARIADKLFEQTLAPVSASETREGVAESEGAQAAAESKETKETKEAEVEQ